MRTANQLTFMTCENSSPTNRKEQNRLVLMNQIEGRKLTVDKAATLLELTGG